jgi:methanogenic corrinoid protein MtbC1
LAFLRVKRAGGRAYVYIVESRWNPSLGHPRQRVLAYLGRLDRVRPEAVPKAYRTPTVLSALATHASAERARLRQGAQNETPLFLGAILGGNRVEARRLARQAVRASGPDVFYSEVLVPALHEVGQRFARREISVSAEHLATGTAAGVLAEMNSELGEAPPGAPEVVLCVPEGEGHTVALLIAEGLLRRKGYRAVNVSGSAPTASILEFVRARRPVAVLISVTIPSRLETGRRLARQLRREHPGMRVAVGGQGTADAFAGREPPGEGELERVPIEEYLGSWPPAG